MNWDDYPKHSARSMRDAGLQYFTVTGGPFASPQTMGLHITNEKGLTVAVSCDTLFCERVNMLNELALLLKRADARYHLAERHDGGYLEMDDEVWERLSELLRTLTSADRTREER
jgi:hypothetical protein